MTAAEGKLTISSRTRIRVAFALAAVADMVQLAVFPLFVEGAASPADDLLDLGVAGVMSLLLGWHWEFLPSFLGKLVPGVDFVPLWTLAVANVWRKSKKVDEAATGPVIEGEIGSSTRRG